MKNRVVIAAAVALLAVFGCSAPHLTLSRFDVNIDWVPSPEYYGFFYAKARGFYEEAGLSVNIFNGTGAAEVAKGLSAGTVYAGTTTSDNLLRELAAGSSFSAAIPLLRFNPCVLVVTPNGIDSFAAVAGKRIGTNKNASVYLQFLKILADRHVPATGITEVPIGYGGADVFRLEEVDGFLAYTTNVVVDLDVSIPPTPYRELAFGDAGIESFGTVLVFNSGAHSKPADITPERFQAFAKATIRGYSEGAVDLPGAVQALRAAAPTLDPTKIRLAIEKIMRLNDSTHYEMERLDRWVGEKDTALTELHRLLTDGLQLQR